MPKNSVVKFQPATAMIFCALCLILVGRLLWIAAGTDVGWSLIGMGFMALFASMAYGLWRQHRFALRGTAALSLLVAILLPLGTFSIFSAGDYWAAGKEPPTILASLIWLVPTEILLLLGAYILDFQQPTEMGIDPGR